MNKLIFLLAVVGIQVSVHAEIRNGSQILNLVNLGQISGKNYFYDKAQSVNWQGANSFCIGAGMRLATIETDSQAAFLRSKYSSNGFNGRFWTAARDSQEPSQFVWDGRGTTPTRLSGLYWGVYQAAPGQWISVVRKNLEWRREVPKCDFVYI